MRSLGVTLSLAAVVAAIPVSLRAQARAPEAFHRGQWGIDFTVANGFVAVGAIHFRSPTQALVLSLTGSASTTTVTYAGGGSTGGNANAIGVSLGARRYRAVAPRVQFSRTLGLEGSYAHTYQSGTTQNTWSGGLFGELGADWLVTPHLGLGGAWRLSADYQHMSSKSGGATASGHGFTLSLGQVHLTGQIYF
jgi:hypothetical protein